MKDRLDNFIELYFEAIQENLEEVIFELKEEGIDPEQSQQDILNFIKKEKGQLKLRQGIQFKGYYLDAVNSEKLHSESSNHDVSRLAARKKSDGFSEEEKNDILSDEEKLKLIKMYKDDSKK